MRELPFDHEPQIAALVAAYRKQLTETETGPEGTVGEYAEKLATLTYDELLERLLVACPDNFAEAAFGGLPGDERIHRLMGLAAGHLRADLHWPLIGEFFDSLRFPSKHDYIDFELVADAIIIAYTQRLNNEQRERVKAALTLDFDFNSVAVGKRLTPWFVDRYKPIGEYYSPWMLKVLGATVGEISHMVFVRWIHRTELINQMLGSYMLNSVTLTLDFRQDARQFWVASSDRLVDSLGACRCAGPDSHQIVLFMHAIAQAAEQLGQGAQVHELGALVFLHEFAHVIHLGEMDTEGLFNPDAPKPWNRKDWVELVAQLFTWSAIKNDAKLAALFEKLTDTLPSEYQTWRTLRECPLEEFRTYLWLLRHNGAVKNGLNFQEWFCAEHPQLPPLPKP